MIKIKKRSIRSGFACEKTWLREVRIRIQINGRSDPNPSFKPRKYHEREKMGNDIFYHYSFNSPHLNRGNSPDPTDTGERKREKD